MKKTISLNQKNKLLFEVADSQQGFFTARQAEEAGFIRSNHSYHVSAGHWIREERGIYRLALFPTTRDHDRLVYSLWSQNIKGEVQGVFSHETALSHYEISDVNPAKIHMTVPKKFRRNSEIPKVLVLHKTDLLKKDIQEVHGFSLTKPLRTIIDVFNNHLSLEHVEKAFHDAINKGLISMSEIRRIDEVPAELRKYFDLWLKDNRMYKKQSA